MKPTPTPDVILWLDERWPWMAPIALVALAAYRMIRPAVAEQIKRRREQLDLERREHADELERLRSEIATRDATIAQLYERLVAANAKQAEFNAASRELADRLLRRSKSPAHSPTPGTASSQRSTTSKTSAPPPRLPLPPRLPRS